MARQLAVAAAFALAACGKPQKTEPAAAGEPASFTREGNRVLVPPSSPLKDQLQIAPAEKRTVRARTLAPATVEADPSKLAKIFPPLAGRVVALHVRFGQNVTKGQPLLTLNAPDMVAAQSDYLRARASLQQAERTVSRQKDLVAHNAASRVPSVCREKAVRSGTKRPGREPREPGSAAPEVG